MTGDVVAEEFVTNRMSEAFNEGAEACHDGAFFESCTYPANTQDRHDWEEGYLAIEAEIAFRS